MSYMPFTLNTSALLKRQRSRRAGLLGMGSLGSVDVCGPEPELAAGEKRTCCPGIGWVVYDVAPLGKTICQAAAEEAGVAPPSDDSASSDPFERVRALEAQLEQEREEFEERRFQEQVQAAQLRAVIRRIQAQKDAKERAELAKLKAQREAREAKERSERNKALLETAKKVGLVGGAIFVGGKLLNLF